MSRGSAKCKGKTTYVKHTWKFVCITAAQEPAEGHVCATYVVFSLQNPAPFENGFAFKDVCDIRVSSFASFTSNRIWFG